MKLFCPLIILCCTTISVPNALLALSLQAEVVPETDRVHSVCEVIQNHKQFDGQTVLIESTVLVSDHATVLEGQQCGKGISLSYTVGRSGEKWKALDDAIAAKSSVLDKRVLRIRVKGIYHNAVQVYKRSIRQLEVIEVIDVELEDGKQPTESVTSSPSAQTVLHESGHADLSKPR